MVQVETIHPKGSPGLVVMRRDSCTSGRGFESQRRILYGAFSTFICFNIVLSFENPKINKTMPGLAHNQND